MKNLLVIIFSIIAFVSCATNTTNLTLDKYLEKKEINYTIGKTAFLNKDGIIIDKDKNPINGIVSKNGKVIPVIITTVKDGRNISILQKYIKEENLENFISLNSVNYTLNIDAFINKTNGLLVDKNGKLITGNIYMKAKNDTKVNYTTVGAVKDGKYEGIVKEFMDNSLVADLLYKNGKKNGLNKYYFPNGYIKAEVNYKDDIKEGITKEYFAEGAYGKVRKESNYKNGVLNGKETVYYTGSINYTQNYVNGVLHGDYRGYFNNGKIVTFKQYINGKLEGPVKLLYPNVNATLMETNYTNDKQNGSEKYFYDDGSLASETIYKDGKRVAPITAYRKDGSKKFILFDEYKHDGYCYGKDGKKSRDFNEKEKGYSITGLMSEEVCQ